MFALKFLRWRTIPETLTTKHFTKWWNRYHQTVEPIPYNKPDSKPDILKEHFFKDSPCYDKQYYMAEINKTVKVNDIYYSLNTALNDPKEKVQIDKVFRENPN